jgi:serine/threonine protein kinase
MARTVSSAQPAPASSAPVAVSTDPASDADYEVLVSQTTIDRRLLSGPFATNVWGGRYAVERFAGEGSQGATFIGTDSKTGARVAIKLFDLGKATDWKAQELFEREVQTLKRLRHPGIPQFLDVVVDDDTGARALVMTHIPGESLGDVWRRDGVIPEKRVWGYVNDAAQILAAVHGEGVIHRDLKPDNFILRPDGTLAIVDFGGVGHVRAAAGSTVVGTFGYMAPEQLYGAQTPATDLYALGATLLTVATNKSPEDQPRRGLAIDVDAAAPFLSSPLRSLLATLLAPDPQERPRDGAALLVMLKALSSGRSTSTSTSTSSTARSPDRVEHADGSVEAIWREDDVNDVVTTTGGVLGVMVSVLAMMATVGLGRFLIPLLVTVVSGFVNPDERRKLKAFGDAVRARTDEAQRLLQRSADHAATQLHGQLKQRDGKRKNKKESAKERRARRRLERIEWLGHHAEQVVKEAVDKKLAERRRQDGSWKYDPPRK